MKPAEMREYLFGLININMRCIEISFRADKKF